MHCFLFYAQKSPSYGISGVHLQGKLLRKNANLQSTVTRDVAFEFAVMRRVHCLNERDLCNRAFGVKSSTWCKIEYLL